MPTIVFMRITATTANKKAKVFFYCALALFVLVVIIVIAAPSEKAPAQHHAARHHNEQSLGMACLQHPETVACRASGADRTNEEAEEALKRSSREAAEGK